MSIDWELNGTVCQELMNIRCLTCDSRIYSARGRHSTKSAHGMVASDGLLNIRIRAALNGNPLAGETLNLRTETEAGSDKMTITETRFQLDEKGRAVYHFTPEVVASSGVYSFILSHPGSIEPHTSYMDAVDTVTFQRFERAARKVKLALPVHLLFLGDSLTDMDRGRNYVDKIEFWLQTVHGSQVTVRNAGMCGDFITRVWDRLEGSPEVFCPGMYNRLFEPLSTEIFILLGANDSKVSNASGYTKPWVSFEDVDAYYRKVIERLRQKTGANITLISSPSFNYEIQKAAAEKMAAENKPHTLFGKPEAVKRFNAVVRKVADDLKCGWIDLYGPTESHPDKQTFYVPEDGVHLNDNGNRFVALAILESMAASSDELKQSVKK